MTTEKNLWQTKVAARLHDPAEKALVLLRDPAGHENGTSRALRRLLGFDQLPQTIDSDNGALSATLFKQGLPAEIYRIVQRADWWAAGADRPQWPMREITVKTRTGEEKTFAVADWAQVRWSNEPHLIHPLSGSQYELGSLADTEINDIKYRSFDHFSGLLTQLNRQNGETPNWKKILLTLWRFGPELDKKADAEDNSHLGALWPLLPADTRIPDHSIWDHLDLVSAFAGAFAGDENGEAALLTFSIGPVQSFIAAARSTSDLWAGSHLLSRLAWETMRPICEALGPDAILFPRLRGIPQVDLWLRDWMNLPDALFEQCEWNKGTTDANPLFSAALPNRFVAIVPASQTRNLTEKCQAAVREWLQGIGKDVVSRLLAEAGFDVEKTSTPYEQMKAQLQGFPEVHWAAIPFSFIRTEGKEKISDISRLKTAMSPFFGVDADKDSGFLETSAWQVLQKEIAWNDGTSFFVPNPGVLYPAIYELAERTLAAAKSVRGFAQKEEKGWRCSLTGEAEWLTTDSTQLEKSYRQQTDTLWAKIAEKHPSWAKKGEHLSALPAIKRLWPTVFAEEAGRALTEVDNGIAKKLDRFVVSTHTMALAHQLKNWLASPEGVSDEIKADAVALPRKLAIMKNVSPEKLNNAKRLPALLDEARDSDNDNALNEAQKKVKVALKVDTLETYYALIMMDGDKMGEMLSGEGDNHITFCKSFHSKVRTGFNRHAQNQALIQKYGEQKRPVSPNRHLAISGALNDFSQTVVRHVVECEHLGRVLYAGGDDVLAMLPVADLVSTMQRLRQAYSGDCLKDEQIAWRDTSKKDRLLCKNGFAWLNNRLMRMMGNKATASCGAVIAHHQAPLNAVMRELRAAEKRTKTEGGRDAFSITVIKRSGGMLRLTAKWGEALETLDMLVDFLRAEDVSRRAVYHTLEWLKDLPDNQPELLEKMLAYQLHRQSGKQRDANELANRLTKLCAQEKTPRKWLENFLTVGEFLAREIRSTEGEAA